MSDKWQQRQFVDTNIFLYAYDISDPAKRKKAADLIKSLWGNKCGCISIQVLQELYVNLTRKIPHPMSSIEAKQIIVDLKSWKHHVPDSISLEKAIDMESKFRLSFWDAMILCSAHQMQCSILWTEDLNAGQNYDGVLVKNPFI
jgi:predicted nucleic acid-binding protein